MFKPQTIQINFRNTPFSHLIYNKYNSYLKWDECVVLLLWNQNPPCVRIELPYITTYFKKDLETTPNIFKTTEQFFM